MHASPRRASCGWRLGGSVQQLRGLIPSCRFQAAYNTHSSTAAPPAATASKTALVYAAGASQIRTVTVPRCRRPASARADVPRSVFVPPLGSITLKTSPFRCSGSARHAPAVSLRASQLSKAPKSATSVTWSGNTRRRRIVLPTPAKAGLAAPSPSGAPSAAPSEEEASSRSFSARTAATPVLFTRMRCRWALSTVAHSAADCGAAASAPVSSSSSAAPPSAADALTGACPAADPAPGGTIDDEASAGCALERAVRHGGLARGLGSTMHWRSAGRRVPARAEAARWATSARAAARSSSPTEAIAASAAGVMVPRNSAGPVAAAAEPRPDVGPGKASASFASAAIASRRASACLPSRASCAAWPADIEDTHESGTSSRRHAASGAPAALPGTGLRNPSLCKNDAAWGALRSASASSALGISTVGVAESDSPAASRFVRSHLIALRFARTAAWCITNRSDAAISGDFCRSSTRVTA